ncbi:MAG: pyruvate dehydrogenase (acetyl-transferring) E1 component subunit alpha [Burkholderiaceae bacterium]|nr:pyruvate dehydrogenase (acetyl-transferring) E1 component subunit alpha [Microbacteriaceae bacterium]
MSTIVTRPHRSDDLSDAERDFVQLVTPDGQRRPHPVFDPFLADVTPALIADLYEDLLVVRRIDAEATALQRQGELGLWPPVLGQEAAQVGSAHALRSDDFAFTSYRESAVAYCRGVKVADLLRIWRGTSHGAWDPYEVKIAVPAIVIGVQTLHATGYALGCQKKGSDTVAITYFGDGATSQGDVNEAMVFAASFRAPVVFFCQNNQWAISEPVGLQSHTRLSDRAPGFGIPSLRIDGNDVLAVLAATRMALDRARGGGGPTFIEAVTYRMGPHTTSDDPTRYRDKAELETWARRDPIDRIAAHLDSLGELTDALRARVTATCDAVAADLRAACLALDPPHPLTMFDNVYAHPHSGIDRQRSQFAAYLAMFEQPGTSPEAGA